tara:strand:- start:92 stop:358 length:267 start_codon:yes stop_codon:yes gene_type:complete
MMQAKLFLKLPKNNDTLNLDFPESGQNTLFGEKAEAPKIFQGDDLKISLDALLPKRKSSVNECKPSQLRPKNDLFEYDKYFRSGKDGS